MKVAKLGISNEGGAGGDSGNARYGEVNGEGGAIRADVKVKQME